MSMILIRADFAKSYVAAHTRTLPSGKVVQVSAFSDKRYKRVERDHDTMDMFKPELPAPKKKIPDECARHPERCTPDLFSGETKSQPFSREKRESLESAHRNKVANEPAVKREFRAKYNALAEAKAKGISMQSRCRYVRAWVSDEKIAGRISEADYDKWIGMVNDIHDENKPAAPAYSAQTATKPEQQGDPKRINAHKWREFGDAVRFNLPPNINERHIKDDHIKHAIQKWAAIGRLLIVGGH